jgi:hypothetical protein
MKDILHPAFEDGPDRGFRNVGKTQSDAEEIPKRKHASFRTRRKSEIKNYSRSSVWNVFSSIRQLVGHPVYRVSQKDM